MAIDHFDDIVTKIHEHLEDGGFADPDLRLLAESVRHIAVKLSAAEDYELEQRERE